MADIRAFRALRYDLGRVGVLSDVVAPPYDVIDAALQDKLYRQSPYNVVRLILNREEPTDSDKDNRYLRAAGFLREWRHQGIVKQDSAQSLYVYHQEFEIEGRRHLRRGFMARVRLEPFGEGKIFPHEETMSGPKADRLLLMRATGMNLSQVFGLYPDELGEVQQQLDDAVGRSLPLEATDHLGVVNRLWPVTDQRVVSEVTGLMGPKPIFIADGHHRYETALRFLEERRAASEVSGPEAAPSFVLMMLVSMTDPGLVILPTHRLVSGLPDLRAAQLADLLKDHAKVERIGEGESAARETWDRIESDGGQEILGFGTVADGVWQTARFRAADAMQRLVPQHRDAWRSLGVSILHVLVLDELVAKTCHCTPKCQYVHLLDEVLQATAARSCQLGVLVPPAQMSHVEEIAGHLEKMPPKSTYFYPKLLSGLLFNPVVGG